MSACDKITTINFRPKFLANVRMAVFEKETCKAKPPLQILGFSFVDCDQIDHPMSAINVVRLMSLLQCYHDHIRIYSKFAEICSPWTIVPSWFSTSKDSLATGITLWTQTQVHTFTYIYIFTHTHSHIHTFTHTHTPTVLDVFLRNLNYRNQVWNYKRVLVHKSHVCDPACMFLSTHWWSQHPACQSCFYKPLRNCNPSEFLHPP